MHLLLPCRRFAWLVPCLFSSIDQVYRRFFLQSQLRRSAGTFAPQPVLSAPLQHARRSIRNGTCGAEIGFCSQINGSEGIMRLGRPRFPRSIPESSGAAIWGSQPPKPHQSFHRVILRCAAHMAAEGRGRASGVALVMRSGDLGKRCSCMSDCVGACGEKAR